MSLQTSAFSPLSHHIQPASFGCLIRRLDTRHVEVWGNDISEHYLLCYDEQQPYLLDVFYLPFEASVERQYGMV